MGKAGLNIIRTGLLVRQPIMFCLDFSCSGSHLTILVSKELDSLICLNRGLAMTEKPLMKCRKYDASPKNCLNDLKVLGGGSLVRASTFLRFGRI